MSQGILIEFFASFVIYFLFAGLFVLWFIDGKIKKEQVLHALFACFLAFMVAEVIKHFFPTLRPFMTNGKHVDVFMKPMNSAFPSEHTIIAFAFAVTVFMHDRKIGWCFLTIALLIGIARVLANVHYPIDIIGGALIGTLTAVIVEKVHLFSFLTSKKKK